jgi:hypothetical protein
MTALQRRFDPNFARVRKAITQDEVRDTIHITQGKGGAQRAIYAEIDAHLDRSGMQAYSRCGSVLYLTFPYCLLSVCLCC